MSADYLSPAELDRFLAWCKSEAKRGEIVHRQMQQFAASAEQQVAAARIGLEVASLTVVALRLERLKAGS